MQNKWPQYTDGDNYVNAAEITAIKQSTMGTASIKLADGAFSDYPASAGFMSLWDPVVGGYLIDMGKEVVYMSKAAFEAKYHETGGTSVTPGDIQGASSVGIGVLTAADEKAGRAAIKAAGQGITAANGSDIAITGLTYDAEGKATGTFKIGDGKVGDRAIASSGLKGTNIKTVATVTSAGGTVNIPAGTDHDAALKMLADAVDPAAG